ncbi:MAG TPA: tripartite tricarboxylate transporter substrate-binding protein [Beijerinckiaceae bacterium]|nr:tripartite tricarboxylate transporter substrate-binding protein [Beijerinckiaceae bacterium]
MKRLLLAAAAAVGLAAVPAQAQDYPNKPVTMIVPFAAGGPTDIIARLVAESMSRTLGQQVIIENVAGAGGTTGSTRASQAAADGYTIMMGHMGTHGAAPGLYKNLKYNPSTDFSPIGLAAGTPIIIVAKKAFPADDLKGFMAHVKANNDKITQAHAGVGSVSFTTCMLLTAQLGVKATAVAYTGTGPALNDLVGGQVDYMCDQIPSVVAQIRAGSVKAIAIALDARSPALPNLPTTKEAGLPEFQVSAWNAVFAPKNLPAPIQAKLADALSKALDDDKVKARLLDLGAVIPQGDGRGPDALAKLVKSEVERWGPILKAVAQ